MTLSEYSLQDTRVLLIGAGRGIGKGIALVMAEAGARVGVVGLTHRNVERVAEETAKIGYKAIPFVGDATNEPEIGKLAPRILDQMGGLDVLINCVGDAIRGPVVRLPDRDEIGMTHKDWQRIIDVNLTEAFICCRAFGSHLITQREGSVINISSYASVRASALRSAYDAAKAGLDQFTRSLALEWAPYGVRVNAINPGVFPDPEQLEPNEMMERQATAKRQVPLGRIGELREVGLLAAYLASGASAYVTGQTFVIDGGLSVA